MLVPWWLGGGFMEIEVGRARVLVTGSAVRVEGREGAIDWVRMTDGRYSIIVDGRVYDLAADVNEETCTVSGRAGVHALQVRDPRRLDSSRTLEQGQSGLQRLHAEMPGKVIRVLVREGETVACDQGLLVIEAMKMQNEIRAPKAGIVKSIGVVAGRTVGSGEFLLSLE